MLHLCTLISKSSKDLCRPNVGPGSVCGHELDSATQRFWKTMLLLGRSSCYPGVRHRLSVYKLAEHHYTYTTVPNTAIWALLTDICSTVSLTSPASKGNAIQLPCCKAWEGIGTPQAGAFSVGWQCSLMEKGGVGEKRLSLVAFIISKFLSPNRMANEAGHCPPFQRMMSLSLGCKMRGKWNGLVIFSTGKFYCNPWPNIFMSGSDLQPGLLLFGGNLTLNKLSHQVCPMEFKQYFPY